MKRKRVRWNKEKTPLGNEVDWLAQVFVGRRCSAKESTILFKRSDDAKRKQSIYSQISFNCYAVGGSNTDFDWFYFTDYLLVYYFTSLTLECFPKTLYYVVQMLLNQYTGAKIVILSAPAKQSMKNTAEEALRLEAQSLHWAFQCTWIDSLILLGGNMSILLLCGLLLL